MKIVESWLKEIVPFRLAPETVAERLGTLGLEVASVERPGELYNGFVVGEILSCEKHPKADRLTVCKVDVGKETLQIVCGAPNVAAGQKVPVGLVGATVPRNQHDPEGKPFVLSRVTLRGVESSGMICSPHELALGDDAGGIMVLDAGAKTGEPLARHLGCEDVVYDVEITPNRPDWLSHIGVAREVGILVKKNPKPPAAMLREGKTPIGKHLKVTVKDRTNCLRFAARMVRGVTVGPSPEWLAQRLRLAGLRPINNVVDVTNYVMLECGHPLHAFDYSLLKGGAIVVRQSTPEESFVTLDGEEHRLPTGAVMVCDAEREVSVAGVMGGANSEIRPETADVVIESACWNPSSIRRTAKALGISTDASQRFERGVDPNGVIYALDRAAQLVCRLAGGELLKGRLDVYPKPIAPRRIALRVAKVNELLGTHLGAKEIVALLLPLGVKAKQRPGLLACVVPTFRVDLEREVDLIEEVARVYGYDRIEAKRVATVDLDNPFPDRTPADIVRDAFSGWGFAEAMSGTMVDEKRARMAGAEEPARLMNPLGTDMAFLRTSLIPGLLDSVRRNQNHGMADIRFFEIGHVFRVDSKAAGRLVGDFYEEERLAILIAGEREPRQWSSKPERCDLFDLKGVVEGVAEKLTLDKARFISYSTSDGLTDSSLSIEIHGVQAGTCGRVRKEICEGFGIEGELFAAELLLSALAPREARKYQSLPKYPKVRRDIAFFVERSIPVEGISAAIRTLGGELLEGVELFDLYEGEKAPEGKKSLAFSLELMSRQKTLTEAEIDAVVRRVVEGLQQEFRATLRSVQ